MLKEEGGGGVEEGSRVTCVESNGVRYWCYSIDGVCTNLLQWLWL